MLVAVFVGTLDPVFRMEEWSDVTGLIASRPAAGVPTAEEEIAEQEAATDVM